MRSILGEVIGEADVTVVDMEAGLEHLSRSGGTLAYADALLVVMEPSRKSVLTAARTAALALELGIPLTVGVGNKVANEADARFLADSCGAEGLTLAGTVPTDPAVTEADRSGRGLVDAGAEAAWAAVSGIAATVDRLLARR